MGFFRGLFNVLGAIMDTAGEFASDESNKCCAKCKHCCTDYDAGYTYYACRDRDTGDAHNWYDENYSKKFRGKWIIGFTSSDIIQKSACGGEKFKYWDEKNNDGSSYGITPEDFDIPPESEMY